jgi:hypothetical protein
MIGRRSLLAVGLSAIGATTVPARVARAALPVPPTNRLAFAIMRGGSEIGRHVLTFDHTGNELAVKIDVRIAVGLGPLVLFRYDHRGSEQWRDGEVLANHADTDDNGTDLKMMARREGASLLVSGSQVAPYLAPPHASPATHWNRAMLNGPLINTENGKLLKPSIRPAGTDTVLVAGRQIRAQRFEVRGDIDFDTWYDAAPSWVGLRFKAKDGSEIRYQRV